MLYFGDIMVETHQKPETNDVSDEELRQMIHSEGGCGYLHRDTGDVWVYQDHFD